MRKKEAATEGGSEWSEPVGGRVTPLEVQQKEFRVTRVGVGYRMREVDEFLDQVTDTLSALIAENERLRAGGGATEGTSASPATSPGVSGPAERGAVDAFLQREKGFLQELGGLVQAHAEELRSMIRAARSEASAASATPTPAVIVPTASAPLASPAVEAAEMEPAPPVAPAPGSAAGSADAEVGAHERREPDPSHDEADSPAGAERATTDEPIRLVEPEPARSGRSEEKEGDSLRELFWGEE